MGGRGRSSGQETRGVDAESLPGGTQEFHNMWSDADDIQQQLGVSAEEAKAMRDAIYEEDDDIGGFSRHWDSIIRRYENGATEEEILNDANVQDAINEHYNGDSDAYMSALKSKAENCEKLIELGPKWNGGELTRGFKHMSDEDLSALTTVGSVVDLNNGTASWSSYEDVARGFAGYYGYGAPVGSFVAHCDGIRNGTSIRNLSFYPDEDEVLCSKGEAFQCVKVEHRPDGEVHAYYKLVGTNVDWSKIKGK